MRIVISSLNYSAAHTSHIEAYIKLIEAIDDIEPLVYVDEAYLKDFKRDGFGRVESCKDVAQLFSKQPMAVIAYNIGFKNLSLARECGKRGIPFVYVLHEPYPGVREALKERKRIPRASAAYALNALTCRQSDKILLASSYASDLFKRNMNGSDEQCVVIPLLFDDRYQPEEKIDRQFFSYIGTFADAHNYKGFLDFVRYAASNDDEIRFLIATSSNIGGLMAREPFPMLVQQGRLVVQQGRYLTNTEIDYCYRSSICTWNMYTRVTQSGVVVNAMMQGAVPICSDIGSMKDAVANGAGGILLAVDSSFDDILAAYRSVTDNAAEWERNVRRVFLESNYYLSQADAMRRLIDSL